MSEQVVQATVSNPSMGKIFTKTATDDVWDGNTLTDSLSGQQIGILMPINHQPCSIAVHGWVVCMRIQNSQA